MTSRRSYRTNISLWAMFVCLFPLTALGATDVAESMLSEQDFLADMAPVFSASRLPQAPADSPVVISVIDRDLIRASGARDIVELFRLVPGFVVGYANAGKPVVAYHGLSGQYSQRMQVLLDGRSLYAPYLFGGIDWNTLAVNLDDIERIEVLQGSNSASYGANALLGMVNIITRTGSQSAGTYASGTKGGSDIRDVSARFGRQTNRGGWRISAGQRSDNGLNHVFDDRKISYLNLQGELQASRNDELMLSIGANKNHLGIGQPRNAGDPERTEITQSAFGQVRWRRSITAGQELSVSYSRTEDDGDDAFFIPVTSNDGLAIDYGRHAMRDHFEYQHYLAFNPSLRGSLGGEYSREEITARQLFNTSDAQRRHSLRLYASTEWKPDEKWTINFGGVLEDESLSERHLAPRLVLNWKPDNVSAWRIGYSEAFRTPSLFEQRSDWRYVYRGQTIDVRYLSRGGLKPEWVRAMELSYLGDWHNEGLRLDARLFHERIRDLITQEKYQLPPGAELNPATGVYDLRNNGTANITGLETQFSYHPSSNRALVFGQYLAKPVASANYISESIPRYGAHIIGSQQFSGNRKASLAYYWTAPIRWIGESNTVPAQRRLDMRLEQAFSFGKSRGNLALVGQAVNGEQAEFHNNQTYPKKVWLMLDMEY